MAFVVILRKVREQTVLLVNSVGGVAAIILMLLVDQTSGIFCMPCNCRILPRSIVQRLCGQLRQGLIINMSVERHRLWEQPVAALIF